ncbi:MAG TPA: helix-turn-helix transcriptional regulator [Gammaproteobacteria bacterium]
MNGTSNEPRAVRQALAALGNTIEVARKQKRITREELAGRMGVSHVTLQRIEQGRATTAIGSVFKALWLLDLPLWPSLDVPAAEEIRLLQGKRDLMAKRAGRPRKFDDDF